MEITAPFTPLAVSGSFGSGTPSEVLSALFGVINFDGPTLAAAGSEKRLEFNLRLAREDAVISPALAREIAELIGLPLRTPPQEHPVKGQGIALLCDGAIVLTMPLSVVVTCDMTVPIHRAIPALVQLLQQHGFAVEWASFRRKNDAAPWGAKADTSNLEEYRVLKETFPAGNPFVFGAIDSDHYFDFIYDNLPRPCPEADVHCNVKLYGVDILNDGIIKTLGAHTIRAPSNKESAHQAVVFDAETPHYESVRVKQSDLHGSVISFESNREAVAALPQLAAQITALKPERFTIAVMSDAGSETMSALKRGQEVGMEAHLFPGYTRQNRTQNTFQHGYTMTKVSFVAEGR